MRLLVRQKVKFNLLESNSRFKVKLYQFITNFFNYFDKCEIRKSTLVSRGKGGFIFEYF